MRIFLIYYIPNNPDVWILLAATEHAKSVSIGPGDFSEIFYISHEGIDIDTLPEGGSVAFDLINELLVVSGDFIADSGERIPDDVPNGAIWATINNLKIEPLDRFAK